MSPQLAQILQAIDQLSPADRTKILQHLTNQTENLAGKISKLNRLSEFLQTEGYYEEDYIQRSMTEIETK